MILRYTLGNTRAPTYKPEISVPFILQDVECGTNSAIGNNELDDIKIWIPNKNCRKSYWPNETT